MIWFFVQVCPPIAVLLCGRPFAAIFNLLLIFPFLQWRHATIMAMEIAEQYTADRRAQMMGQYIQGVEVGVRKLSPGQPRLPAKRKVDPPLIEAPDVGTRGTQFAHKDRWRD